MIKLCAIDLDGTLFDNQKRISEENKIAIKKAKDNGCKIVIATGRPYHGVLPVLKELNLITDADYVICYNGAKVFNTKTLEIIFATTISGKTVKEIYAESKRLETFFHAFRKNEELITDIHNPYTDVEVHINQIEDHIIDFRKIKDQEEFLKCMMVGKDSVINYALKNLDPKFNQNYSIVRSSKIFLEFLNKKTNKGTALKALAKYLNIQTNEIMAIGDAGNDLAMIQMAHIGVAMENSFEEVKKVANFITTSNEASGVARALNKYINGK